MTRLKAESHTLYPSAKTYGFDGFEGRILEFSFQHRFFHEEVNNYVNIFDCGGTSLAGRDCFI